jgi:undecaprenyl-phosphate 4-deoxy-4-formamido-L-arabinose transferase
MAPTSRSCRRCERRRQSHEPRSTLAGTTTIGRSHGGGRAAPAQLVRPPSALGSINPPSLVDALAARQAGKSDYFGGLLPEAAGEESAAVCLIVNVSVRSVSVVVPVYNSAAILPRLVERLKSVLESAVDEYELVLVNDASVDDSWSCIVALAEEDAAVRGYDLAHNFGQHAATLAGVRAARGDVVVTIDDDLQNPPEEIPRLLSKLDDGYDVVYGIAVTGDRGFVRNVLTWMTKRALRIAIGPNVPTNVSGYRAFHTRLRETFEDFRSPYVSVDVLLSWGARSFTSVPVRHEPRRDGASGYTYGALMTHALNVLTGFTTRPLRVVSLIGLATMLFGAAVLVYVLAYYIVNQGDVPGFPFLASIITIFAGAQLLSLGTIGEYIARMHMRMMGKPPYAVRGSVEAGAPPMLASVHEESDSN